MGWTFLSLSFTEHSVSRKPRSNANLLSILVSREWANKYWISSTRVRALDTPKMALNVLKSTLMGFAAILGASSAHTLVDEIQYLFAHSLLTIIPRGWALLLGFLDTLCSVKENDKKVQPWQGPHK